MSPPSAALAATPSKVRSCITNDPANRHGRSAQARRVRDLFAAYWASLDHTPDVGTQALILAAAEGVAIAEKARLDHIAGNTDLNSVVRAEGTAARALRRIGLNRAAPPPPRKSFADRLAEIEAVRPVEASSDDDVPGASDPAASSDEAMGELPAETRL